jgi:hypothetical protein
MDDDKLTIEISLASSEEVRHINESLAMIQHKLEKLMSQISDFAARQKAHNDKISSDLDAFSVDLKAHNDLIAKLQQSPGVLNPDDASLLDQIDSSGAALADKADKLAGVVPPVVPDAGGGPPPPPPPTPDH